jgi:hypothetical protein
MAFEAQERLPVEIPDEDLPDVPQEFEADHDRAPDAASVAAAS